MTAVLKSLLEILKNGDNDDIRSEAAMALGRIKDPATVEPMIDIFKNETPSHAKVYTYMNTGEEVGRDPYYPVRTAMVLAFGEIGDPRAIDVLSESLETRYWGQQELVPLALGRIGGLRVVQPLISATKDKFGDTRDIALQRLGFIGKGAVAKILEAKEDEDLSAWRSALKQIVETLIEALDIEDSVSQRHALGALTGITGQKFVQKRAVWQEWWDQKKSLFPH